MGQDVDVRLQGAGFDDHFVPGVVAGWGRTQLIGLARAGPEHLQSAISFWAAVLRVSKGFNGLLPGCKQTPCELEKS